MLNDLAEIIAIKSEMGEAQEGAPFGVECRKALDWFLAKAKSYGFATCNMDGYCGYAEYGTGDTCIGVLCHLDVVPAGEGWTTDPYKLVIEDGYLYGRGVVDDKGSVVMCLNALKEIKDSAIKLRRRIRIIVGCNEEHGSECIKYYVQHGEIPAMSFVPDSDFPLINSEKGILHLMYSVPLDDFFAKNIAYISGGESYNVVPDHAKLSIFKDSPLGKQIMNICGGKVSDKIFTSSQVVGGILASGVRVEDYKATDEGEVITIETKGVAGHAMAPFSADNAIWKLFKFLACFGSSEIVSFMNEYICTPICAEALGIYKCDEVSGDLTMSMGIIKVDDNKLYFSLDMRLPISASHEEIKKQILSKLPGRAKIEEETFKPNLYIDKTSTLIQTLLKVYEESTGKEGKCLICGGGTYARELPNAVAFGPTFEGTETNIHNIDEHVSIEEFHKAAEIYKKAMIALAK
ncbi:MAG: Sapep family Mn(2+)-dependent dipeptidase [Clostridiales bacterium]|nr:Sapep family Mn(2+)-dependent dipeptidase [Clostridiales bacterium]